MVPGRHWNVREEKYEQLAEGEGRYVSPRPMTEEFERKLMDKDNKVTHKWESYATGFDTVDFPFKVVKPQILKGLETTLKRKLFDEIGILPTTRKGDPVLVGRIRRRESGYQEPTLSFLIAWWIDSRDL